MGSQECAPPMGSETAVSWQGPHGIALGTIRVAVLRVTRSNFIELSLCGSKIRCRIMNLKVGINIL